MYSVWSQEFLEERQRDEHVCLVGQDQWQRIHEEQEDVRRVFLRLRPQAEETGDLVAALGHPVLTTDLDVGTRPIFLPGWMLQTLRLEGMGEAVRVEVLNDEALPAATKIVLRPHDSAFYGVDSNEELEPVLTRFGVLTAGTTIPVRVDALDNNPSALMQQRHYREDFNRNNYDDQNDQGDLVPDLNEVEIIPEIQA